MNGSENPMPEPRPAASLTGNLLARRGGARPAMRRQPILSGLAVGSHHDDLGWNDMGEAPHEERAVVEPISATVPPVESSPPAISPIAEQISVLTERLKAPARAKAKASPAKTRPATLAGTNRKAAFTLRIDAERHLRLRLLSAMANRSAQQLLTEALDTMIAQNSELRALAEQIESKQAAPSNSGKRQP